MDRLRLIDSTVICTYFGFGRGHRRINIVLFADQRDINGSTVAECRRKVECNRICYIGTGRGAGSREAMLL